MELFSMEIAELISVQTRGGWLSVSFRCWSRASLVMQSCGWLLVALRLRNLLRYWHAPAICINRVGADRPLAVDVKERGDGTSSVKTADPLLHVVLYQPDIPQNTGNIGRTCVAVGAKLWLVRPLGFQLDEKHLRRAGMDYWPLLDWEAVDHWEEVVERLAGRPFWLVENPAERLVWDATFTPGDVLVFGSETRGLPAALIERYRSQTIQFPMRPEVRSLNLASTVNTAVYEAVRQFGGLPG